MDGRLLKTGQAAGYLGISPSQVLIFTRNGLLPFVLIHRSKHVDRYLYRISDLNTFIEQNRYEMKVWKETDESLPTSVVTRILGTTITVTKKLKCEVLNNGPWTPSAVREQVEYRFQRRIRRELKLLRMYKFKAHWRKQEIELLRRRLMQKTCHWCGREQYVTLQDRVNPEHWTPTRRTPMDTGS